MSEMLKRLWIVIAIYIYIYIYIFIGTEDGIAEKLLLLKMKFVVIYNLLIMLLCQTYELNNIFCNYTFTKYEKQPCQNSILNKRLFKKLIG